MRKRDHTTNLGEVKVYSLTVAAAAKRVGVSTETVKRWARAGRVDARKNTSGNWVFNTDDIDAMQDRHVVVERVPS